MENFLWVEKYRPETIDDCVLPNHLKDTFKEFVKNKSIPNIILCGSAGVGKTTVAKAMIKIANENLKKTILESDEIVEISSG